MSPSKDLYTRLVAGCLFPLHEQLKGHSSVARRVAMEERQWWDRDRLRDWQSRELREFLGRVGRQVPYYRRLFGELGFDPAAVAGPADLARLPVLTKALIREHIDDLKAADAGSLGRFNTGGSSGEPLIFYIGRERVSDDVAAKWRATRWWGVDIGDPEIVIWGSPIELGAQDRVRAVRDRLLRTQLLPAFAMSEAQLDGFLEAIRASRPKMLFGYPSAMSHIARHAQGRGQRLDELGIKVAFVTSERLYDEQRAVIADAFGCPVANGYGGRDAGFIAHECPAGSMHLTESIIVETVDREGHPLPPGQAGEIVVTHLATGEFPFVRYRTGDVGVLDDRDCPCGRGLPLVRELQGRTTDFVVAMDGTVLHGLALIYILRDLAGVESFKIIQESRERVRVQVVPGPAFGESARQTIETGFRARLGAAVIVDVETVAEIPPERSGKYRYVVSQVTV